VEPLPPTLALPSNISKTIELLKTAKNPLVIIGKGVSYADAHQEILSFV